MSDEQLLRRTSIISLDDEELAAKASAYAGPVSDAVVKEIARRLSKRRSLVLEKLVEEREIKLDASEVEA